jgi:hypothetical protein
MKVHARQGTVVSIFGAMLIVVCICGAQSAQPGPAAVPVGNAKSLLLERNEGEPRVRRAVLGAPSQSAAQPSAAVPFILKVSRKNNGSEHLVVITEDLLPMGTRGSSCLPARVGYGAL